MEHEHEADDRSIVKFNRYFAIFFCTKPIDLVPMYENMIIERYFNSKFILWKAISNTMLNSQITGHSNLELISIFCDKPRAIKEQFSGSNELASPKKDTKGNESSLWPLKAIKKDNAILLRSRMTLCFVLLPNWINSLK